MVVEKGYDITEEGTLQRVVAVIREALPEEVAGQHTSKSFIKRVSERSPSRSPEGLRPGGGVLSAAGGAYSVIGSSGQSDATVVRKRSVLDAVDSGMGDGGMGSGWEAPLYHNMPDDRGEGEREGEGGTPCPSLADLCTRAHMCTGRGLPVVPMNMHTCTHAHMHTCAHQCTHSCTHSCTCAHVQVRGTRTRTPLDPTRPRSFRAPGRDPVPTRDPIGAVIGDPTRAPWVELNCIQYHIVVLSTDPRQGQPPPPPPITPFYDLHADSNVT